MREEFLYAAKEFVGCGLCVEATRCLINAHEFLLAAELYAKMGQVCVRACVVVCVRVYINASDCVRSGFSHVQVVFWELRSEGLATDCTWQFFGGEE